MKTKPEHIAFWITQASDDWEAVNALLTGKKNLQALFFAHLVVEKLCKAIWIKYNIDNVPPKTHNLIYILSQTEMDLPDENAELLLKLNVFQLEGRYPDYLTEMNKITTDIFTKELIESTNQLRIWLLQKLQ